MSPFTKPLLFNSIIGQRIRRIIPWVGLLMFLAMVAAILTPVFMSAKYVATQTVGIANLKSLVMGCLTYADDYGYRLPRADRWVDSIDPYVHTKKGLRNPYRDDGDFGYGMNSDVSAKLEADLVNPAGTILIYESRGMGRNHSSPSTKIPEDALTDKWGRRVGVAFCDGLVHALDFGRLRDAAAHPDTFELKY